MKKQIDGVTVKVAVLQMNSSAEIDENLAFVQNQLQQAQAQGVKLVLLPENFAQLAVKSRQQTVEPQDGGRIQAFLSSLAQECDMSIIAGSIPTESSSKDRAFARCSVYDDNGARIGSYDKIHLFDVDLADGQRYRESDIYTPGSIDPADQNLRIVDTKVATKAGPIIARLGLSICYDLRFPELYRKLAVGGAQILCVPSAFTYETGRVHWQTLLQARAIENQCYVLAAAQVGKHANGRITWGHSMIIDPWGEVIAQLESDTGLLVCDIDLVQLTNIRTQFPALKHRRLNYD